MLIKLGKTKALFFCELNVYALGFGSTLLTVVFMKEESNCSCLSLATDVLIVWYSLSSMKRQQSWHVCGCVHRLSTTEQNFGPCFRLPGQNKSSLWKKVMMVLQRQLCSCYTVWLHRLRLRTAKKPSFSLMKVKTRADPLMQRTGSHKLCSYRRGSIENQEKTHRESDREAGKGDMQISHQSPSWQRNCSLLRQPVAGV